MKKAICFCLLFSFISAAFGNSIKFHLVDAELELPLEGVRVVLKGNTSIKTESDENGDAELLFPDGFKNGTVIFQLPGYSDNEKIVSVLDSEITVTMSVTGVIEGKELVVKRSAPVEESKSGVATVMSKDQMKSVANAGLVEDVMSAVNTLPGVSYTGNFNSEPSIRGGYPREMSTVLDGIYILYPWHWGGAYSIFNPAMVESVKMSNGVYSAKYGRALSGLMEATTTRPDSGKFHGDLSVTYLSTDAFFQVPLGQKGGLLVGGKCTYLEGYIGAIRLMSGGNDPTKPLKRPPYIRDFYAKAYYTPNDSLELSLNAFYGSDGLQVYMDENVDFHKEKMEFDYDIHRGFVGLNAKWMASKKVQLKGLLSYNITYEDLAFTSSTEGCFFYNSDFKQKFGNLMTNPSAEYYYLNKQKDEMSEKITEHQWQGKLESDIELAHNQIISFGTEEVLARSNTDEKMCGWMEWKNNDGQVDLLNMNINMNTSGNFMLNSALFATWNFGSESTLFQGEAGVRLDHVYTWNPDDNFSLNTYPDVNPRFTISCTPWRNKGIFDKITFSVGSGLFSATPMEFILASDEFDLDDFDVSQNRAWFNVIGTDIAFLENWNFKLEAYYKYYLKRMYTVQNDRNPYDVTYDVDTDGDGYTFGFDTMLEKKIGEKWDGYLSYSFIYSRFKNPYKPVYEDQTTTNGDPLDEWYYPSFHRFNTLNLVLNFRPKKGWTITTKAVFATGKPKRDSGDIYCYAAKNYDGTVIQRYTRSSFYSDTLRQDISCPIDIRIAYGSNLKKHSNVYREWYIAAEDILQGIYSPSHDKSFDRRTGKETDQSASADFSLGVPLISMGMKFKF